MLSNLGPNHKRLQRLLESLGLTRSSFSCPNYSQCKQKKKDRSGKKCNSRLHFLIFQLIFPLLLCYRRKSFAWLFSPPFVIYNAEFIFRPPLSLSSILWKGEVCDDDDTIFIHFKMSTSLKKSQTTKEESFFYPCFEKTLQNPAWCTRCLKITKNVALEIGRQTILVAASCLFIKKTQR